MKNRHIAFQQNPTKAVRRRYKVPSKLRKDTSSNTRRITVILRKEWRQDEGVREALKARARRWGQLRARSPPGLRGEETSMFYGSSKSDSAFPSSLASRRKARAKRVHYHQADGGVESIVVPRSEPGDGNPPWLLEANNSGEKVGRNKGVAEEVKRRGEKRWGGRGEELAISEVNYRGRDYFLSSGASLEEARSSAVGGPTFSCEEKKYEVP
ncbi:hypothetical protein KM043_009268 [Ampulex compressa]|nr:hypothetical protein KM043_009268 [Ampulex compressa]